MNIEPIGHIRCGFSEKFGIPRQSGLVETPAKIVFEPKFRSADAFRGLEGYSHIWILWEFDRAKKEGENVSLTVRGSEEIRGWECLPHAPPSDPTP